ncbi:MAG: HD domain-containing protein [Clostridiales bacterium]|nr:HD domain-containing protein [Clostridiales bacterium]
MSKNEFKISLSQLILALSDAVDMISPVLNNHHKQVTYIAYNIAKQIKLPSEKMSDLIIASLIHDIGALSLQDRVDVMAFEENNPYYHTINGYILLHDLPNLERAAEIVKYHHVPWQDGGGKSFMGDTVHIESHILYLADRIAVSINRKDNILKQTDKIIKRIKSQSNLKFHPDLVKAFEDISKKDAFWLDIVSFCIDKKLNIIFNKYDQEVNLEELSEITAVFARIIDFRSRFTSVHSSGVTEVAETIARLLKWSEEDCIKMRIAGYLHDIGKLMVPTEILEKPSSLTKEEYNIVREHTYHGYYLLDNIDGLEEINEYASFHHERLDGTGYPFRIKGEDLKEGSRIMAVADVFTAITEDRPYRKGMNEKNALRVLEQMGKNLSLDSDLVQIVKENFDIINRKRINAQKRAAEEYEEFTKKLEKVKKKYTA